MGCRNGWTHDHNQSQSKLVSNEPFDLHEQLICWNYVINHGLGRHQGAGCTCTVALDSIQWIVFAYNIHFNHAFSSLDMDERDSIVVCVL